VNLFDTNFQVIFENDVGRNFSDRSEISIRRYVPLSCFITSAVSRALVMRVNTICWTATSSFISLLRRKSPRSTYSSTSSIDVEVEQTDDLVDGEDEQRRGTVAEP
jgi:hypothetical protein